MKSMPPTPIVPLPEQPPGMSARDWARMTAYILAPPATRSIEAVFQAEGGKKGAGGCKRRPPGSFYRAAERWGFKEAAAEYDRAVAALEAAELEATRKQGRKDRAALVEKFVASASLLLDDPTILASLPAGTSAAVLRAFQASRLEFGSDILPEDQERERGGLLRRSDQPVIEVFLSGPEATPLPASQMPEADKIAPNFHPDADEHPALPIATPGL